MNVDASCMHPIDSLLIEKRYCTFWLYKEFRSVSLPFPIFNGNVKIYIFQSGRSTMFHIELHNALWLFIVVFMLHDFEEIITNVA